ncbi:uncharacterized protein METZ01_LOCUS48113 [marine metagenome]|uniref:SsuA/THI5-like domain-containing protein n=1 Tax=marine metagenome TaxID=408172 RepID=A0A381RW00_9ZZZZ
MEEITLKTAIGNYGHTRPLKDGRIQSARFDMNHVEVSPVPMIFRRMVRGLEFDVAEMALSTYICAKHYGKQFTALPVFLTRSFYHAGINCHSRSGIESPEQLAGRRVGVRSYTLTPGVWTRGILQSEYGLDLDDVTWVLSGDEHVEEYVAPSNVVSASSNDLSEMLLSGEVDAVIGAGKIESPDVRPLFGNPYKKDKKWFDKTRIYPISHLLVVSDEKLQEYPWLAEEIYAVYKAAKDLYVKKLKSSNVSDPEDHPLIEMGKIVAGDPLPYSFEEERNALDTFIRFNVDQKIIPEYVNPENLFAKWTHSFL